MDADRRLFISKALALLGSIGYLVLLGLLLFLIAGLASGGSGALASFIGSLVAVLILLCAIVVWAVSMLCYAISFVLSRGARSSFLRISYAIGSLSALAWLLTSALTVSSKILQESPAISMPEASVLLVSGFSVIVLSLMARAR